MDFVTCILAILSFFSSVHSTNLYQTWENILETDPCSQIYVTFSVNNNSELGNKFQTNIVAHQHLSHSKSVLFFTLSNNGTHKLNMLRPIKQFSSNCFTSIIMFPENYKIVEKEVESIQRILTSLKKPLTYKSSDKYVFLISHKNQLQDMFVFPFFRNMNKWLSCSTLHSPSHQKCTTFVITVTKRVKSMI